METLNSKPKHSAQPASDALTALARLLAQQAARELAEDNSAESNAPIQPKSKA